MSRRAAISPPRRPCSWRSLRAGPAWASRWLARPRLTPTPLSSRSAPVNTVEPPAEKPAEAPSQVNDIKSGSTPAQAVGAGKQKKPKADLNDESSSKKKKKKGLSKLNPF